MSIVSIIKATAINHEHNMITDPGSADKELHSKYIGEKQ